MLLSELVPFPAERPGVLRAIRPGVAAAAALGASRRDRVLLLNRSRATLPVLSPAGALPVSGGDCMEAREPAGDARSVEEREAEGEESVGV
mmetsp:Transcript_6590/g.20585  ORF Transcript_6590/g.20585 Transcript_6590/m.20585 type:complete len:91 (+) Transcript_6590:1336-1608(+)|eukprot:scaffold218341_cov31-Tisochrysis_lutea.AAC.2